MLLAARLHTGGFLSRGTIRFGKMSVLPSPLHVSNTEVGAAATCYSFGSSSGEPRVKWRTSQCGHLASRSVDRCSPALEAEKCPETDAKGAYNDRLPQSWVFCERSLAGKNKKRSPGIVAFTPGATAFLRVPTAGHLLDDEGHRAALRISLSYLASHEHMGRVQLRCKGQCTCKPQFIDAHVASDVRNSSVYLLIAFEVTLPLLSSPEAPDSREVCEVEARVLPQTSSGEHKFKLQQVMVTPVRNHFIKEAARENG